MAPLTGLLLATVAFMALSDRGNPTAPHGAEAAADLGIEHRISEIGGVIRSAAPAERGELKELAETLLRQEMSSIPEDSVPRSETKKGRSNPLFAGILLALLGLIFFLLFPLVGAAIGAIGIALMIWGAVLSALRK